MMDQEQWLKTIARMNPAAIEVFFGIDSPEAGAARDKTPKYKSRWLKQKRRSEPNRTLPPPYRPRVPVPEDLASLERVFGPAYSLFHAGLALYHQSRMTDSIQYLTCALEMAKFKDSSSSYQLFPVYAFLGRSFSFIFQREDAHSSFDYALKLNSGDTTPRNLWVGKVLLWDGWVLTDLMRYEEARGRLEQAVDVFKNGPNADEKFLYHTYGYLADILRVLHFDRPADDMEALGEGLRQKSLKAEPRKSESRWEYYYTGPDGMTFLAESESEKGMLSDRLQFMYATYKNFSYDPRMSDSTLKPARPAHGWRPKIRPNLPTIR